jgi:hypothetical protein
METLIEDSNNPYGVHPRLWKWNPRIDGPAFSHFLEVSELPDSAHEYLRSFTPRVLGQASPPKVDAHSTGLVIGRVQSGKTNSFIALSALASDNGYQLIIILSGTKNLLKGQTHRQAVNKLSRGVRGWKVVDFDPDVDRADFENWLSIALSEVRPRTLVVSLLKRTRLSPTNGGTSEGVDRLCEFLERSDFRSRLAETAAVIIDDEADEASLDNSANARRSGRSVLPTPTHQAINRLRGALPKHLFVQYTATPQANLLVELSNQLSPDFCELLEPGEGYCGAAEFFPKTEDHWIEIPEPDAEAALAGSVIPPPSLVDALYLFFVAGALEDHIGERRIPQPRSMLVHPGRIVTSHSTARRWVQQVRASMFELASQALDTPDSPLARDFLQEIGRAIAELRQTLPEMEIRPESLLPELHARLEESEIKLINSRQQANEEIDWDETASWIFVGGDVLQRGFAIKGLTVTWMPRSVGGGQVDVLMQRGRFFGYRQDYFGYCRVYLPRSAHDNYYALFADHEAALWRSLRNHLAKGLGLEEWSRAFWLDPSPTMTLCRRSSQWFRLRRQSEWSSQLWFPGPAQVAEIGAAATNARVVQGLFEDVKWRTPWRPVEENTDREHEYAIVPLRTVLQVLLNYQFFGADQVEHAVSVDAASVLLDLDDDARAVVLRMRPRAREIRRQTDHSPMIRSLLGGRSKVTDPHRSDYYPGDREFRAGGEGISEVEEDLFTIQVHEPTLIRKSNGAVLTSSTGYLRLGCPMLAIFIPEVARSYRRETAGDRRHV